MWGLHLVLQLEGVAREVLQAPLVGTCALVSLPGIALTVSGRGFSYIVAPIELTVPSPSGCATALVVSYRAGAIPWPDGVGLPRAPCKVGKVIEPCGVFVSDN